LRRPNDTREALLISLAQVSVPLLLGALYKDLDLSKAQIFLVDLGHSVLSTFSQKSQVYAARMLARAARRASAARNRR
jgi:hypothetical protein